MPIRESQRALYPKDWPEISRRIRERAGNRCETCGVENYALGGRDSDGYWWPAIPRGEKLLGLDWPAPGERAWCMREGASMHLRIIRIVLTVAHLNHDPTDCADSNLKAWCQRCHLTYDAKHHARNAAATRRSRKASGDLLDMPESLRRP